MTMKPIGDTVIIKPDVAPDASPGGIVYTDTKKAVDWKIKRIGTVVAVGNGRRLKNGGRAKIDLRPGDKVHFQPMAEAVEIDGQLLVFAKEEWILAKIEGN